MECFCCFREMSSFKKIRSISIDTNMFSWQMVFWAPIKIYKCEYCSEKSLIKDSDFQEWKKAISEQIKKRVSEPSFDMIAFVNAYETLLI